MKNKCRIIRLLVPVFLLGLSVTALAQPGGSGRIGTGPGGPGMDVLAPLKATIRSSEAPGLSTDQEEELRTLISQFRDVFQISKGDADIRPAREEYEKAILNSDSETAASKAVIIANAQAAEMARRESDAAVFAIAVVKILKENPEQYQALVDQVGEEGVVHLAIDLAGAPKRGRHGPAPHGPGAGPDGFKPGPGRFGPGPTGLGPGEPPPQKEPFIP
jgi:hypothetical protein